MLPVHQYRYYAAPVLMLITQARGSRLRPITPRSWCRTACEVQVVARMRTQTLPAVIGCFVLALAFATSISNASPVDPSQVEVLDGDTIRTGGETFRLIGLTRRRRIVLNVRPSGSLGVGQHFGFGSLWPLAVSILNASPVRAQTERKEHSAAIRTLVRHSQSARTGRRYVADRGGFGSHICLWAHVLFWAKSMVLPTP